ncbi:MAG: zf-HC2 domain-containing protein [Saccharofermentanales bacterium]
MLSEYIDGNLSEKHTAEFLEHIKTCDYCRYIAETSVLSLKMTSGYKRTNSEAHAGISPERIEQSKSSLIKALRMEPGYGERSEPVVTALKQDKDRGSLLRRLATMKFSSYASVAAIFIVAVTTLILYSGSGLVGNFRANFLIKQATMDSSYEETYGRSSSTEGTKDSEMMTGSTENANNDTGFPASPEDDGLKPDLSISLDALSPSSSTSSFREFSSSEIGMADRIYLTGQGYAWLDGENEMKYIAAASESLFSTEYSDSLYEYVGIFAFPDGTADSYLETFKTILSNAAVNANIEITGGENSQKLVEYTGEGEASEMLSKAEINDATLLIISIGR